MKNYYDIAIIGAGASGMAAGIIAKRDNPELSVAIFEKNKRAGLKLAITGKGKCNITNKFSPEYEKSLEFLRSIGIDVIEKDEGRLYPSDENAESVVKNLVSEIERLGIDLVFEKAVTKLDKTCGAGFQMEFADGTSSSSGKVLLATGGKSYPKCGTTGDGYVLARKLGHGIETLIPGLTAVKTVQSTEHLNGIRSKGTVRLIKDGEVIFKERGEVQFAGGYVSGIVVMNMSLLYRNDGSRYEMELDLSGNPKLGDKLLRFELSTLKGWKDAQITCGGISLDDVNRDTMESSILPGLYFSGEILNYQGPCGGYNLNNAWVTGITAGHGLAKK